VSLLPAAGQKEKSPGGRRERERDRPFLSPYRWGERGGGKEDEGGKGRVAAITHPPVATGRLLKGKKKEVGRKRGEEKGFRRLLLLLTPPRSSPGRKEEGKKKWRKRSPK